MLVILLCFCRKGVRFRLLLCTLVTNFGGVGIFCILCRRLGVFGGLGLGRVVMGVGCLGLVLAGILWIRVFCLLAY